MRSSSAFVSTSWASRINLIIIGNLRAWNFKKERGIRRAPDFKPAEPLAQGLSAFGVDAGLFIRTLYCGCPRPGAGRGLAAFAAQSGRARAGVHKHGNWIAPGRHLNASLLSRQSQSERPDDFCRRHFSRGAYLDRAG